MRRADFASTVSSILERDFAGLIVVFEDGGIIFHFEDYRELEPMAFELNRFPHLPARISTANIRFSTTDTTDGL
jgi:hypothetical protein